MFTIKELREDVCVWCNRKSEGVEVDFGNLKGFLCRADFWRVARARTERKDKGGQPKQGAPGDK